MFSTDLLALPLGFLPVLSFLLVLILLDSYKLVQLRAVAYLLVMGCVAAGLSLPVNVWVADALRLDQAALARYAAPVTEELLKGAVVVYLIRARRLGFLVDSSICGFAVGAGFAAVENLHYFVFHSSSNLLVLMMSRGFGPAVMHGGVTAILAILSKYLADRRGSTSAVVFVPGWLMATTIHSAFNHFILSPNLSTMLLLIVLPMFFVLVFRISESRTREWLGIGFDSDAELLELINSGKMSQSRIGEYLEVLKARFPGGTVADIICLLRVRLELSIRAKGILLMREAGFSVPPDPEIEAQFEELKYLEKSVGKTGLLALSPVFHMSDRDLWQYHMLARG